VSNVLVVREARYSTPILKELNMKFRFSYDVTSTAGRYESSLNLTGFIGCGAFGEYGSILQMGRML